MIGNVFLYTSWITLTLVTIEAADTGADECGADNTAELSHYSRPLHVGSIFIICGASLLGVAIPILSKFVPPLSIPDNVVTYGKSFGVGVILATAFVHMLVPSFEKLASPCLGYVWNEVYPAFGGLFAMCAILIMQLIEYFASNELEHHFRDLEELQPPHPTTTCSFNNRPTATAAAVVCDHQSIDRATIVDGYLSHPSPSNTLLHPPPHPPAPRLPPPPPPSTSTSTSTTTITTIQQNQRDKRYHPFNTCPAHSHFSNQSDELKDKKRYLNTIVLEFGILAHSVIIGITLGVSPQSEFATLLVAICFHQFFEGFALGARIAEVKMICLEKATIMCMCFTLTTPIGTAIGVGISSGYNPKSQTALLTQGIFDSISAGILIYVSLVDLMATEMLFDDRFKAMKPITRIGCFFFVFAGAAVMAVIGIWA